MSRITELSQIEIVDNEALEAYLKAARQLARDLAAEFRFGAEEIRTRLATIPGAVGAFGLDSRVRARRVAAPMNKAAEAIEYAAVMAVKTDALFRKHFAPELDTVRKPSKQQFRVI